MPDTVHSKPNTKVGAQSPLQCVTWLTLAKVAGDWEIPGWGTLAFRGCPSYLSIFRYFPHTDTMLVLAEAKLPVFSVYECQ